jgi:hypothetical protein
MTPSLKCKSVAMYFAALAVAHLGGKHMLEIFTVVCL